MKSCAPVVHALEPRPRFAALVVLLLCLLSFSACSRVKVKPRDEVPVGENEIRRVLTLYTEYKAIVQKPPANVSVLKAWAGKLNKNQKDTLLAGVTNLDSVFNSPRDNQPYVIRGPAAASNPNAVVVYEKNGVNGMRFVGYTAGSVAELDEEAFRTNVPEAK